MDVDQNDSEIDIRPGVPEFAQAWHPSVRRPTLLPHPATYHESINPDAIFELRQTPTSEYIYVVPRKCTYCTSVKQSCSRLSPCTRCSNAGRSCDSSILEGYHRLPPPKATRKRSSISESIPKASSLLRPKRAAATQPIIDQKPLAKKLKLASASLGPPGRPIERRRDKEKVDPPPQKISIANTPTSTSTAPIWTPVKPGKTQYSNDNSAPAPNIHILDTPPRTPRVWANSRAELTAIFPEFTKTITGISWQKFDVPTLFLGRHRPEDAWRDENTLEITREWSYSCVPEALEDPHDDCHAARVECGSVQNEVRSFSLDYVLNPLPFASPLIVESEALPCNDTQLRMMAPRRSSRLQLPPVLSPCPTPQPNLPAVPPPSALIIQPFRLPVQKPPEIETLVQSRACSVPLLVFASQESGLLPQPLSAEYACVCLGFFFISDISLEKISMSITPTHVVGRVRWRVTLEWAPGGEDGLLQNADVRTHPWWIDPTNCPVEKGAGSVKMHYRPRNLSDQYFSFLPLDLLADFKPSEFFPRGWYCRECGMLNAQRFFRHQICQSSQCKLKLERGKATSNDNALIGHVDLLQALQDLHHFVRIHDPLDVAPSSVCGTDYSWDDGMRTLAYEVNSGTNVKHVFTGNQEILQEDATRLLLAVQKDVILSRSDLQSPYFTWSTKPDPGQTYTGDTEEKPDIPKPILDVQDVLLRYMHGYGEISDSNINHILIQAWVTPGSKRGTLFKATSHAITILCLGAEVVMNLVPKRGFAEISIESTENPMDVDIDDGERILSAPYPVDDGSECPSETVGSAAVIDEPDPEVTCLQYVSDFSVANSTSHNGARDASRLSKAMQAGVKPRKKAPLELSLTLVHGDAVILDGDDFECQIKRSGTTIREYFFELKGFLISKVK